MPIFFLADVNISLADVNIILANVNILLKKMQPAVQTIHLILDREADLERKGRESEVDFPSLSSFQWYSRFLALKLLLTLQGRKVAGQHVPIQCRRGGNPPRSP